MVVHDLTIDGTFSYPPRMKLSTALALDPGKSGFAIPLSVGSQVQVPTMISGSREAGSASKHS